MAKGKGAGVPAKGAEGGSAPAKSGKDNAPAQKKKQANPFEFIQQVRNEAGKVTWTTWKETRLSTIMVLIMVTFAAVYFFLVDQILGAIVRFLLSLGG
ncbi:MAG: preprotein translocase subunit SecE [Pseudomonadota bacterium]